MTKSPTFSPAAETTTPPRTSGPTAPGLRHLGRRHRCRYGCIITRITGRRSAHPAFRQSADAKLTVPLQIIPQRLVIQSWRSTKFNDGDPDSTLILAFTPEGTNG